MRNEKHILIEDEGRDKGKLFIVREMPAAQAEKWALRALLIVARSGIEIPADIGEAGMAGVAQIGIQTIMRNAAKFEEMEPLLDEMWNSCIAYAPDPKMPHIVRGAYPSAIGPLLDDDVEEIMTRLHLRAEVLNIHTGFSGAGAPSRK